MFSVEGYENSFVENSNVPIGWIFECLDKNSPSFKKIKGDSKILKLNVEDISGGKGYASKVYKSTVHFEGDENKTYEFILKIPGIESFSDLFENETDKADITETFDIETVATFHNQETVFYTMTTKEIEDLKVPSCYGGRGLIPHKQDGCLIMEFLSPSSDNIPYYQSFNVYQAKSMLEEIMKLQVFSLTDGKHWKSKFKPLFNRKVFKSLVKLINTGFNHFKEIFPKEMVNEIEADFKTYVSKYDDIGMYSIEGIPDCRGHNSVLCHGDLWTNNIMFEVDSERRFTNDVKVVIDWQSIYQGCVGADIARLIVSGCSPEVRREIEVLHLPKYFDELKKKVLEKGGEFDMTYETFKNSYDFCMFEQSFLTFGLFGIFESKMKSNIDEENCIWEARKFTLASKSFFAFKDGIERCKKIVDGWSNN